MKVCVCIPNQDWSSVALHMYLHFSWPRIEVESSIRTISSLCSTSICRKSFFMHPYIIHGKAWLAVIVQFNSWSFNIFDPFFLSMVVYLLLLSGCGTMCISYMDNTYEVVIGPLTMGLIWCERSEILTNREKKPTPYLLLNTERVHIEYVDVPTFAGIKLRPSFGGTAWMHFKVHTYIHTYVGKNILRISSPWRLSNCSGSTGLVKSKSAVSCETDSHRDLTETSGKTGRRQRWHRENDCHRSTSPSIVDPCLEETSLILFHRDSVRPITGARLMLWSTSSAVGGSWTNRSVSPSRVDSMEVHTLLVRIRILHPTVLIPHHYIILGILSRIVWLNARRIIQAASQKIGV